MLNIHELERKWLIYKFKSYIPHIVITISLVIIFVVLIIFNLKPKDITLSKEQNNIQNIKKLDNIKEEINQDKLILKPSYTFIHNIQTSINIKKEIYIPKQQIIIKTQNNKNILNIKRQNTKDDISIILKRFNNNKNPALSLFIAKRYYEIKDYKKSYKYAFITNELDNKIEDSWILFIKSMIKLDQKNKAIKTLKKYIQHTNSSTAKILLDEIYSGKIQ